MNNWYVLTGGPGAGKTTLINTLAGRGYRTVSEAARTYIEEALAQGKTIGEIRRDEIAFQQAVIRLKVAAEATLPPFEPIFLDRGMHDSVAYLALYGVEQDAELAAAVARTRYQKVFLLDMVAFEADGVRTETLEQAQQIHKHLQRVYEEAGQSVVRVPVLPVEERANFILEHIHIYA